MYVRMYLNCSGVKSPFINSGFLFLLFPLTLDVLPVAPEQVTKGQNLPFAGSWGGGQQNLQMLEV